MSHDSPKKLTLVVHSGRCHADDVFAAATLQLRFGVEGVEITRTRDEATIAAADVVADVGHECDPDRNRFDHHQPGGAGNRENGVPYASFGLVWRKFGPEICESDDVSRAVDERLVQPIDAGDNGFAIAESKPGLPEEFSLDAVVKMFNPSWLEDESGHDAAFSELLPFARRLLERAVEHAKARAKGNELAEAAYAGSADRRLLVIDGPYPFMDMAKRHPELLFVVSPDVFANRWNVRAVDEPNFRQRKKLPAAWAGLRDAELEAATGVEGAVFCPRGLYFCAAKTREAALALAALALGA